MPWHTPEQRARLAKPYTWGLAPGKNWDLDVLAGAGNQPGSHSGDAAPNHPNVHDPSVDLDQRIVSDGRAELTHDPSTDANASADDELFRAAARCYPGRREILLETQRPG